MTKINGIASRLKAKGASLHSNKNPLWKGPRVDGITQSMISRWLYCRERFRLNVIEGLQPSPKFNARTDYGSMWHVCEESLANEEDWQINLKCYCQGLCERNRESQQQVVHWYEICKLQFPMYVAFWRKHPDVKGRMPMMAEQVFEVPYTTRGFNKVKLRGMWDSVDEVKGEVWLQENKTKGDIDEESIKRQLEGGDLQSMLYLTALQSWLGKNAKKLVGVRYNVVRRPLGGGKHSIVQRKGRMTKKGIVGAESVEEFRERLGSVIAANEGDFFFRINAKIYTSDLDKFRYECLDPILDQICLWYDSVTGKNYENGIHFRYPQGVYNPTLGGYASDLDNYLNTGSIVGLTKVKSLFRELE